MTQVIPSEVTHTWESDTPENILEGYRLLQSNLHRINMENNKAKSKILVPVIIFLFGLIFWACATYVDNHPELHPLVQSLVFIWGMFSLIPVSWVVIYICVSNPLINIYNRYVVRSLDAIIQFHQTEGNRVSLDSAQSFEKIKTVSKEMQKIYTLQKRLTYVAKILRSKLNQKQYEQMWLLFWESNKHIIDYLSALKHTLTTTIQEQVSVLERAKDQARWLHHVHLQQELCIRLDGQIKQFEALQKMIHI